MSNIHTNLIKPQILQPYIGVNTNAKEITNEFSH